MCKGMWRGCHNDCHGKYGVARRCSTTNRAELQLRPTLRRLCGRHCDGGDILGCVACPAMAAANPHAQEILVWQSCAQCAIENDRLNVSDGGKLASSGRPGQCACSASRRCTHSQPNPQIHPVQCVHQRDGTEGSAYTETKSRWRRRRKKTRVEDDRRESSIENEVLNCSSAPLAGSAAASLSLASHHRPAGRSCSAGSGRTSAPTGR